MATNTKLSNRKPSKVRAVPIAQMRVPPALIVQREFRQAHADHLCANMDPNKLGYPIVNLRDGIYWLVDGQHRVAALKMWDPSIVDTNLDCEVYENLTNAEMADIFLGRGDSKHIPTYDKFHVSCTAGHERELAIKRAVEVNGQKFSRSHVSGISAVGSLAKVYDTSGEAVLNQVIRTIRGGFEGDPLGFERSVIEGLGLVYNRYNGRTNEVNLAKRLGGLRQGARELLRKAESLRERTGSPKKQCVAAVVVDIYNKGEGSNHSKGRLPAWWKEPAQ